MIVKLMRHGQSTQNTEEESFLEVGDHRIGLTEAGEIQARKAGKLLGAKFLRQALIYHSPYERVRKTVDFVLLGAGIDPSETSVQEDPQLREVEHGYYDVAPQEPMRIIHGWFYYRFRGGESPADCYDRMDTFLSSLMRHVERRKPVDNVLIVTHGLTIRCFIMRFLHLSVEQFETLENPDNCEVVTLAPKELIDEPQFARGRWAVSGLRFYPES